MGMFYHNITLRGASQGDVVTLLRSLGRQAIVSKAIDETLVVFDQEFAWGGVIDRRLMDPDGWGFEPGKTAWQPLVAALSRRLHCVALGAEVYDDDYLYYELYETGKIIDEYVSMAERFQRSRYALHETCGDTKLLCARLGVSRNEHEVAALLHGGEDRYVFAHDFHDDLVRVLGLPIISGSWRY
ncbi:MAG: hypothetical protein LC793_01550 [Thermomicrobia bacterium]|nr:hypothetical protein [Thermomicrobia bacterium]MCA1723037.1 hypothetical protein [Thermomicrobia bacterium]